MSDSSKSDHVGKTQAPATQSVSVPVVESTPWSIREVWEKHERVFQNIASLTAFVIAFWLLHHEFKTIHVADVAASCFECRNDLI